jgi:glc operon protein GlcG
MNQSSAAAQVDALIEAITRLVPEFSAQPRNSFSGGNVALCIIDANQQVRGRMFGTDKLAMRKVFHTAWTKASQVWITGMKTHDYEQKVFNGEIDYKQAGILPPDFIGWRGGQPVLLKDGTMLAAGFSGFTGEADLEIVRMAAASMGL